MSASIMGSSEVVAKLGQSLAPMLVYALLPQLQGPGGAAQVTAGPADTGNGSVVSSALAAGLRGWFQRAVAFAGSGMRPVSFTGEPPVTTDNSNFLRAVAWGLLLVIPTATVALQLAVWSRYKGSTTATRATERIRSEAKPVPGAA